MVCMEENSYTVQTVAYPGILFGGGFEDRENGDLGAVAP